MHVSVMCSSLCLPPHFIIPLIPLQHTRAHNDPIAMNSSFAEVLHCDNRCHPKTIALRNKCLEPGLYAQHLKVWLQQYKRTQVSYIHLTTGCKGRVRLQLPGSRLYCMLRSKVSKRK